MLWDWVIGAMVIFVLAIVIWHRPIGGFWRKPKAINEEHFDESDDYTEPKVPEAVANEMGHAEFKGDQEPRLVEAALQAVGEETFVAANNERHQSGAQFEPEVKQNWKNTVKGNYTKHLETINSKPPAEKINIRTTTQTAPVWQKVSHDVKENPIIAIFVLAARSQKYSGEQVARQLLAQQLVKTEHNTYAAYNEQAQMMFQVASALKPGTFDEATLSIMRTPGLVFLLDANSTQQPLVAFKKMLATVHNVATALGADILDANRERLTDSGVAEYLAMIKSIENRSIHVA